MCRDVLTSMTVALGTSNTRFSASLNNDGDISVTGAVKGGSPFLTSLGNFGVDIVMEARHSCCMSVDASVRTPRRCLADERQ